MKPELIPILADALRGYYQQSELEQLSGIFDAELEYEGYQLSYIRIASNLILKPEFGNNRRFLDTIVPSLLSRCEEQIAITKWERREYHEGMKPRLEMLTSLLGETRIPTEIAVEEKHPFTAKSEIRDLLLCAETEVTVLDQYIGIGTLDCIRVVSHPIRILTGDKDQCIESGFDRVLSEFRAEGHQIEVRQHSRLHDRYVVFNQRCWLVGSSLKDVGKKTFNMIECIDTREFILKQIELKWNEATQY
jgi:hypothetical protein